MRHLILTGLFALLLPTWLHAQETFYSIGVYDLEPTDGRKTVRPRALDLDSSRGPEFVALDGEGEAYLTAQLPGMAANTRPRLVVRRSKPGDVTGRLVYRGRSRSEMVPFRIPGARASTEAANDYREVRAAVLTELLREGVPGAAWFRHELLELTGGKEDRLRAWRATARQSHDSTLDLFVGGRAVAENLQLERTLPPSRSRDATVPLSEIKGVTVREMDFSRLLEGVSPPRKDPLAHCIPEDQYAVFFPNVLAFAAVVETLDREGTPILHAWEPRAEDARTLQRYQKQLGISLDGLAREVERIRSVAFTGSDPYLRTGSDVALLFESKKARELAPKLRQRRGVAPVVERHGVIANVGYTGWVSPDRSVSSYMASTDGIVVISNSLVQLRRILKTTAGETGSVGQLDEYAFFRHRYRRGGDEEAALLVIPDQAIRKWCGPRWRIAASRRIRAAAELSDLHVRWRERIVAGAAGDSDLSAKGAPAMLGRLTFGSAGVRSSVYNTLAFQTPIAELETVRVTEEEAQMYARWRDGYERNWSNYFDPIAIRFSLTDFRLGLDATVMPLIAGSDYREMVEVSRGARIAATSGDRHEGSLLHLAYTLNTDSPRFRSMMSWLDLPAKGLAHPLAWLGDSVSVYVDPSPEFFRGWLAARNDSWDYLEKNLFRLPIALHCEVKSPLKLAIFLTALRAYVEDTAADLTVWESRIHEGVKYMRIGVPGAEEFSEELGGLAIYYAATRDGLVLTLDEGLLKRALDRFSARAKVRAEGGGVPEPAPWLGEHLNGELDLSALQSLELIDFFDMGSLGDRQRKTSWASLTILNEWKRLHPELDPVEVHEALFGVRLVCPGGGQYVWNGTWQTMESTVYGHPAAPRGLGKGNPPLASWDRLRFGITFENEGLRARCELTR